MGDHVLAVDGIELTGMTQAEANHFLNNSTAKILQLEILPVGQFYEQQLGKCLSDRSGLTIGELALYSADIRCSWCFNAIDFSSF